ncbi:MAG: hypothetical protein EAZ30_14670 [Betaproteobacteria bacterium]|nr:MAG: hypothetical protein EAZ30_14670 [Betaproteobacteria bacterium]
MKHARTTQCALVIALLTTSAAAFGASPADSQSRVDSSPFAKPASSVTTFKLRPNAPQVGVVTQPVIDLALEATDLSGGGKSVCVVNRGNVPAPAISMQVENVYSFRDTTPDDGRSRGAGVSRSTQMIPALSVGASHCSTHAPSHRFSKKLSFRLDVASSFADQQPRNNVLIVRLPQTGA